jgi:hypothetical protein
MYVKLPGGRLFPGGYIVPCEVHHMVNDTRGGVMGAYVRLSSEDGHHSWVQYVKVDLLLNDDEAERES